MNTQTKTVRILPLWLGMTLLLALVVGGCAGPNPASPAPSTPTAASTNTPAPTPTTPPTSSRGTPSAQAADTPEPEPTIILPAELPMKGQKDAKVILVEFSDFQ